jgi:hypothetical protein
MCIYVGGMGNGETTPRSDEYSCTGLGGDGLEPDPVGTGKGNSGVGGGSGDIPPDPQDTLVNALRNLPQRCIDAFGGQEKVNGWIDQVRNGAIHFAGANSTDPIPNSPYNHTVRDFVAFSKRDPAKFAGFTVAYNDNGGGYYDMHQYNTIILGYSFYDPYQYDRAGLARVGTVTEYRMLTLVHEFLHWETSGNHRVIAEKLNLAGRGFNIDTEGAAS